MTSSAGMLIIYVVAFIAIFYFMAIRPQQRQRKAHAALLSSLKKGDNVITASGIYGRVKRVEENLVVIEVAKGVSIKIARQAIAQIIRDAKEARAFAPEPTGRKGKAAVAEIEEEIEEEATASEEIVEEAAAEEFDAVVEDVEAVEDVVADDMTEEEMAEAIVDEVDEAVEEPEFADEDADVTEDEPSQGTRS